MSLHIFENQEEWEKVHGAVDSGPMMTLEDGEEVYKVWVLGVEEEELQEIKILSKQRESDGKVKMVIVWEYLDKNKDGLDIVDWLTDERFMEIAYNTMIALGKKYPECVWEKVDTLQFHFAK